MASKSGCMEGALQCKALFLMCYSEGDCLKLAILYSSRPMLHKASKVWIPLRLAKMVSTTTHRHAPQQMHQHWIGQQGCQVGAMCAGDEGDTSMGDAARGRHFLRVACRAHERGDYCSGMSAKLSIGPHPCVPLVCRFHPQLQHAACGSAPPPA
jgi:hypothetical protein